MERNADGTVVSVERVIHAPASAIFAVVADASRHPEIDGSGTVVKAKPGAPEHLELGSEFGMSMKMGVPYSMVNTVIEFEPDRRIAWQAKPSGFFGRFVGGRIWRYEFQRDRRWRPPVRESWDITQDKQRSFLKRGKVGEQTAGNMTKTLERLAEITES